MLKFKEKNSLQTQIDSYSQMLDENRDKLELLGVSDLSKAIKEINRKFK